jgi:hypothetical protein
MSNKDKKNVVWMGEIPFGQEDKFRYPTEEEVEMAFYEADNLTEEEYDNMTEKEKEEYLFTCIAAMIGAESSSDILLSFTEKQKMSNKDKIIWIGVVIATSIIIGIVVGNWLMINS